MIRMKQEEYFNYLTSRNKVKKIIRRILFLRPIAREFNGKVLDVGCGIGEFLEIYSNAIGIDPNKYNMKYCKNLGFNVKVGSVYNLKFKKNYFDGILLMNVLEHLSKPDKAIKEIKKVLKKNGKLIITVPTKAGFKRDKTHVKFWGRQVLSEFLVKNGFKVKKIFYYPFKLFKDLFWFNELRVIAIKVE